MDRRQRKTREAIFHALTQLLSKKDYNQITVGEIIEMADVARATFYAHFETKDHLLRAFCQELFCHIFDTEQLNHQNHRHIFACESSDPVFLHLLRHLKNNDNNILALLSSRNNELFLKYFRGNLEALIESHAAELESPKSRQIPEAIWKNHIASTFVELIRWWIAGGLKESPEAIAEYFLMLIQ
jgi:AcrR family transcriptional regulator